MKHTITNIVFLIFFCSLVIYAQDRFQVKQQAETKLKSMSSDEIEAKIKELGLTREQATQKAKDFGISLEDFLRGSTVELPGAIEEELPKESSKQSKSVQKDVPTMKFQDSIAIPGFSGRAGILRTVLPFGYDMFQYTETTFEPIVNVATPPTYLLGVGDEVIISVWGETRLNYTLKINKEGNIVIPDVGPVTAVGNTIQQLREKLLKRMTSVYSSLRNGAADASTSMDVSLGKLKTIQVFVLGEVNRPGGYSLSSLATIMQALYLSGGPTSGGSLRDVQLKRDGKSFKSLDVYDYLTKADNSKDVRLQDGDIVFVKPVGKRVALIGNLFRPAIYELKPGEKLKDVIGIAGGLLFDSYFNRIHIERIIPFEKRAEYQKNLMDIDIQFQSFEDLMKSSFDVQDGDIVSFYKINDFLQNRISVSGNIKKPGLYEFISGMKVKDIIIKADSLTDVTLSKGFVFRYLPDRRREIISFNPNKALQDDPTHNLSLQNEDSVVVYNQLKFYPSRTVDIYGEVRRPGRYPRNEKMTISDLIVLAGGFTENAYTDSVELSSLDTTDINEIMKSKKIRISKNYSENEFGLGTELKDLDVVNIAQDPKISDVQLISIYGLVKYPGVYPVLKVGDRISDIIERAGGLLDNAYLEGATYTRKVKGTGMVPFDLKKALTDNKSPDNVQVNGGDSIYIWWKDDVVYMRGEFYVPLPVLYKEGASIDYYISQAGGFTDEANDDAVAAYLPTGKKWESAWGFLPDDDILPGTTIIVPKKVEKPDTTWPYVRDIVTTLASLLAITVSVISITK